VADHQSSGDPPPSSESPVRKAGLQLGRGFLMGSADIVPGVSGGTIALVLGIYRTLIAQIRMGSTALGRMARLDVKGGVERLGAVDWWFLLPLLAGIGAAVVTLARIISHLLEEAPQAMAGLFFGLVVGSVVVAWRLLAQRDPTRLAVGVAVAVAAFVLLGLQGGEVTDPSLLAVFGAGALAICAMILPGVSGSFLLLMVGMYQYVLDSVNDRDVVVLVVLLAGCVVGLALFSQALHWALERHEDTVMAGLIGLMLGSLRVLWPWPEGTDGTAIELPTLDAAVVPIALAVAGFGLVLAITWASERLEGRSDADLADDLRA
jgi:putative membrane protein